jgi:hypothetical protein
MKDEDRRCKGFCDGPKSRVRGTTTPCFWRSVRADVSRTLVVSDGGPVSVVAHSPHLEGCPNRLANPLDIGGRDLGPISDSAALSIVWSAALRSLVPRGVDKTVFFSVLFPATRLFEGRRFRSVSCSQRGDEMRPIAKSEPVSIFWRAPPNSGSFLGLFPARCAKPSSSLSCSTDVPCRHGLVHRFDRARNLTPPGRSAGRFVRRRRPDVGRPTPVRNRRP